MGLLERLLAFSSLPPLVVPSCLASLTDAAYAAQTDGSPSEQAIHFVSIDRSIDCDALLARQVDSNCQCLSSMYACGIARFRSSADLFPPRTHRQQQQQQQAAIIMSHAEFGRGDTGIHTVEGNLAGARAAKLTQKREKDQQAFEAKKRKIQEESERSVGDFGQKFTSIQHDAFKVRCTPS